MFEELYVRTKRPDPFTRCEIKISLEKSKPFSCSPRRLSYSKKEQLQKLSDEGIIRNSDSEYTSPIVLVKKKTGDLRLYIDYRKLNKILIKDYYPLPLIDDLLDKLLNKSVFSKLDLKNGYFHVFVGDDSIKYTSFVTQLGKLEFLRMSMGIKNASAVFQRFVNWIFADLIRESKVIVYMDDIMITSANIEKDLKTVKYV